LANDFPASVHAALREARDEVNVDVAPKERWQVIQRQIHFPISEINQVCQRYRVRELALFGSALRDDFSDASDIDLLVEFDPEARVSFITLARMQRELSALLHRRVDLVPKRGLKPRIRQSVLDSAEVVYAA